MRGRSAQCLCMCVLLALVGRTLRQRRPPGWLVHKRERASDLRTLARTMATPKTTRWLPPRFVCMEAGECSKPPPFSSLTGRTSHKRWRTPQATDNPKPTQEDRQTLAHKEGHSHFRSLIALQTAVESSAVWCSVKNRRERRTH